MNILAVSYNNIWPFEDRLISVNLKWWKYLIKSPIWTWKSFLFFDWILFGLYKYSNRNMLNRKSKEWFVKVLFENNWDHFIVSRFLKHTKSWWESVNSRLYKLDEKFDFIDNDDIIKYWSDIILSFEDRSEEIEFKSWNELQKTLEDLLPPEEVFLSTNFLMQDSDNIFEMTPVDRINIFKNMFGLIWIDVAKDKIADDKKEIQLNIKIMQDSTNYDYKLKEYINWILNIRKNISNKNIFKDDLLNDMILKINAMDIYSDFELIKDVVNIWGFDIRWFDMWLFDQYDGIVDIYKSEYQNLSWKYDIIKSSFEINQDKIKKLNKEKLDNDRQISSFENSIKNIDKSLEENIKKQKKKFIDEVEELIKNISFDKIIWFWYDIKKDIYEANNLVEQIISEWKEHKDNIDKIDTSIWNIELHIKLLIDKKKDLDIQSSNLDIKINEISENIDRQRTFYCDKIESNCPYVEKIKWDSLKLIDKQYQNLLKEKEELLIKISNENIDKNINKYEKDIVDLDIQKKDFIEKSEKLKNILSEINWKSIKQNFEEYKNLNQKIRQLDKDLENFEIEKKKLKDYEDKILSLRSYNEWLSKQIFELENDNIKKGEDIESYKQLLKSYNIEWLSLLNKDMNNLKDYMWNILYIVDEFKKSQIKVKKLQEDEKILNDLYQIFSKELMLLVLQEFLPSLADFINNLLSQVVDYELKFDLIKTSADKLELDIKIIDDKWERAVKSLSWWQKTILKLVWILAVSSMLRSKFLFLDETINNLDFETVWKVSDLLTDFIKTNNIKFYVVTHSQQIQDMDIWDETVMIEK